MSKRNISYVKPQDPSFLAKLKAEIGYDAGPNIDTKRQKLCENNDSASDEEFAEQRTDEQPQIVVLKDGDLTAAQVELEKQRLLREKAETKADLSQPIVFKQRSKRSEADKSLESELGKKQEKKSSSSSQKSSNKKQTTKLSFAYDDEEEETN